MLQLHPNVSSCGVLENTHCGKNTDVLELVGVRLMFSPQHVQLYMLVVETGSSDT